MKTRYYVVIGVDVPGLCALDATPEQEKTAVARFVRVTLRNAFHSRDVNATVGEAIGLTADDVDRVVLALRDDTQKLTTNWQEQKDRLDQKLVELSALVDRVIAEPGETP